MLTDFEVELPAALCSVGEARRLLEDFVRPLQLPAEQVEDLKIALSEACTNAVCHGCKVDPSSRIRVQFAASSSVISIEVEDCGCGAIPETITLPDPEQLTTGGRGLFLMQALMDEVKFERRGGSTLVRLMLHHHPPLTD